MLEIFLIYGIRNNGVTTRIAVNNENEDEYKYYDGRNGDYYGIIRRAMKGGYEKGLGPNFSDGSGISTVLVEHGYLSNEHDRNIMYSEGGLKALAKADCDAIVEFYSLKKPEENKRVYSYPETCIFDSHYYANRYTDLFNAFGYDENLLRAHYDTFGIDEGRSASPTFDPEFYLNNNEDLKIAFGNDYRAAYNHFINSGIKEGRCTSMAFDCLCYLRNNLDLQSAFGNENYEEAFYHFVRSGINEGRIASPNFDVVYYLNNNADLKAAFGDNYRAATEHFMLSGYKENRLVVDVNI